jgi:ubiquinone/menaquinone biosynthesis C-methylase UbiE
MKISNQQEVWNNIAEEWHEFKTNPSENAQKFLKNKKGNILDLGSGSGRNLLGLKSKAEFYLVDFSEKMIKLAKERLQKENISAEFLVSDLTKLPYEDNFFDYAICVAALHCIETEKKRKKVVENFIGL